MSTAPANDDQREFRCIHCDGKILVPKSLPPTTGPCPHCKLEITSPGAEAEDKPAEVDPIFGKPTSANPVVPVANPVVPVAKEPELPPEAPSMPETVSEAKAEPESVTQEVIDEPEASEPSAAEKEKQHEQEVEEKQAQVVAARLEAQKKHDEHERELVEQQKQEAVDSREAEAAKVADRKESEREPVAESVEDTPEEHEILKGGKPVAENKPRSKRRLPVGALLVLFVLLALGAAALVLIPKVLNRSVEPPVVQSPQNRGLREKEYLESGWEADAREVLEQFLTAERPAGKAAFSVRGSELLEKMDRFYDDLRIDDSDTPMEAFAVFPLVMKDKERGIFMLTYDQPPVFELSEFFVPLSPLAVQHGVEDPGLLLASVARRSNFTAEPLKVHAIFKRTPDGLRLDWETFVQTKYRTMRSFLELPVSGTRKVFRVIVAETVPENRRAPAGFRTYMIADPAYPKEDSARVNVAVDSEIGQALSILNWRGTKDGRAISKTATLELGWNDEASPQLEVTQFICWEFLGVGGEAVPGAR